MAKRPHQSGESLEGFDEIERFLAQSLSPVEPSPEFVHYLGYRLTNPAAVVLENQNRTSAFLIMALGLFMGAFTFWIWTRLR